MGALRYGPALPFVVMASPALAVGLGQGEAPAIPWARIGLALAFCIALAAGTILMMRRYHGYSRIRHSFPLRQGDRRAIEIVETRRVSQHGDVCLLRCRGQDYLFVVTPHHTLVLDTYEGCGE